MPKLTKQKQLIEQGFIGVRLRQGWKDERIKNEIINLVDSGEISPETIQNWKRGLVRPRSTKWPAFVALVKVCVKFGGMDERWANELLQEVEAPLDVARQLLRELGFRYIGDLEPVNNYYIGDGLPDLKLFFGRENLLEDLFDAMQRAESRAIVGPHRVGKTSILNFIDSVICYPHLDHLRISHQKRWLQVPNNFHCIYIDFLRSDMSHPEGVLRFILKGMELQAPERCTPNEFTGIIADNAPLKKRFVILLDEITNAIGGDKLNRGFWDNLRANHQASGRKLVFISASRTLPKHDADTKGEGSDFFSILLKRGLGAFTKAEALDLLQNSDQQFPPEEVDWILKTSELYPIALQSICQIRKDVLRQGGTMSDWKSQAREACSRWLQKIRQEGSSGLDGSD